MNRFYLGHVDPDWLQSAGVPMLYSPEHLGDRPPRATAAWALDSGGFSELTRHGAWRATPAEYVDTVRWATSRVGRPDFVGIQDWVCAPAALAATGLSVVDHQARTVRSLLDLRALAPDIAWLPTLQGHTAADYYACAYAYEQAGVSLAYEPLVGLGSIASRQHDPEVGRIVRHLAGMGMSLHGFGVKKTGVAMYGDALEAADSAAWSVTARYERRPAQRGLHQRAIMRMSDECEAEYQAGLHPATCASCLRYALAWRDEVLALAADRDRRASASQLFAPDHTYRPAVAPPALAPRFDLAKNVAAPQLSLDHDEEDPAA